MLEMTLVYTFQYFPIFCSLFFCLYSELESIKDQIPNVPGFFHMSPESKTQTEKHETKNSHASTYSKWILNRQKPKHFFFFKHSSLHACCQQLFSPIGFLWTLNNLWLAKRGEQLENICVCSEMQEWKTNGKIVEKRKGLIGKKKSEGRVNEIPRLFRHLVERWLMDGYVD